MDEQEKTNDLFRLIKEFRKKIPTSKTLAEDAIKFCEALENTVPNIKTEIEFEEKIDILEEKLEKEEERCTQLEGKLMREKNDTEKLEKEQSIILVTLQELVDHTPDAKLREQLNRLKEFIETDSIEGAPGLSVWLQLQ